MLPRYIDLRRTICGDSPESHAQEHPESTGRAVEQLLALAEDRSPASRGGMAAALRALAPLLGDDQVCVIATGHTSRPQFCQQDSTDALYKLGTRRFAASAHQSINLCCLYLCG